MNDLDLDTLERQWTSGNWPSIAKPQILALIQRLREAEAELSEWRQPNMLTEVEYRERTAKLKAHIAQLERVREAAIKALREWDDDHSRTPDCNFPEEELRAAIAASNNE